MAKRKYQQEIEAQGSGTERYRESRDWTNTGDGTDYPTSTYRVLRPTEHNRELYLFGDAIDLTVEEAGPLLVKHHIDKPETVQLTVRREPSRIPATPPTPTRVVEGTTSDPAPTAPNGTVTTNLNTTA